jgi:hypothetical protein
MSPVQQTFDPRDHTSPANLQVLRQVEAYLLWNSEITNNLVSRLEGHIADIDQKLISTELESQERKKTRRSCNKVFKKLGHCRSEAQILRDALDEVRLKIAAQEQLSGGFALPTYLHVAPVSPSANTLSSVISPGYHLQGLQSPITLGQPQALEHPWTPYPYLHGQHPHIFSPSPTPHLFSRSTLARNEIVNDQYQTSPYPVSLQTLYSPTSMIYGFSSMPVRVVMPFYPQLTPSPGTVGYAGIPCSDPCNGLQGLDPRSTLETAVRLSNPPTNRRSCRKSASPNNTLEGLPVQMPKSTCFDGPCPSQEHLRRYSAAAVDMIGHRLRSTKLNGRRKGHRSTTSDP